MNILYYKWLSYNSNLTVRALKNLGHNVEICDRKFKGYEIDAELMQELVFMVHEKHCDCIFSLNYIPILASVAQSCGIRYVSWTEDSPAYPLYSPTRNYPCNYEYVFDKEELYRLQVTGSSRVFPATLASDPTFFDEQIKKHSPMESEVCFLGTLYSKTDFERIAFKDDYLKGYTDGLIQAQKFVYGCNLIEPALTPDIAKSILSLCNDDVPDGYCIDERYAAAYVLEKKVTGCERVEYLSEIGKHFDLTIHTGSQPDPTVNATYKGYADYDTEMPRIFHDAKINLHFAPRNIHSGVSLRVFDVLACHGFLLTTWQPEIAELFEDGKELVIFSEKEELLDKISYYLKHDDERKKIAEEGYNKICCDYTYEKILSRLLCFDS